MKFEGIHITCERSRTLQIAISKHIGNTNSIKKYCKITWTKERDQTLGVLIVFLSLLMQNIPEAIIIQGKKNSISCLEDYRSSVPSQSCIKAEILHCDSSIGADQSDNRARRRVFLDVAHLHALKRFFFPISFVVLNNRLCFIHIECTPDMLCFKKQNVSINFTEHESGLRFKCDPSIMVA